MQHPEKFDLRDPARFTSRNMPSSSLKRIIIWAALVSFRMFTSSLERKERHATN
jgi:hypothetical protein